MPKVITYYVILVIIVIGLFGAGSLVIEEFQTGEGCPKIVSIPICVVILTCFSVLFITHFFNKWCVVYYLFTGLAAGIALIASIMQYTGNGECPKTNSGIPMCYYSLLLCSILIILKTYHQKLNKL